MTKNGANRIFGVISNIFPAITLADIFFVSGDAAYSSSQDAFKRQEEKERIYVRLFIRTLILSVIITLTTILMGYPVAFLLSNIPLRISNLLMILVLLPFWTSLLVRTSSWIVLLQEKGVVNEI